MKSNSTDTTLLMIAKTMALSDGSISEKERDLIIDLPNRLGLSTDMQVDELNMPSMTELAQQIVSHGDKLLAARIAGLVAGVSKNTEDKDYINSQERLAYRELLSALKLTEQEIAEIEWSVKEELLKGQSLIEIMIKYINQGITPDPGNIGPPMPL